jgi:hypothetical protein
MSFLSAIVDKFRSAPKDHKTDRYGILTPLLANGEVVAATIDMCNVLKASQYADMLRGRIKPTSNHAEKSVQAYNEYVKHLSGSVQSMERAEPFSMIVQALDNIRQNLMSVEDNFQNLFGSVDMSSPETTMRTSSMFVMGYIEKSENFCTWLASFIEHLTADSKDLIPPFRTRELLGKADLAAKFAYLNLTKWHPKHGGIQAEIKTMQAKGADLPIQTATGEWVDQFAHDSQFNSDEQELMAASIRGTIMMMIDMGTVRTQAKLDLLEARKEWLTSKVIEQQAKSRGLDESSPEYRRLKKITEAYASRISKHEQKIERLRG